MKRTIALTLLATTLLGGCSFIPETVRPNVDSSAAWKEAAAPTAPSAIAQDWWKSFGSAELDALMDEALTENLDLRAALQRVAQSRAALRVAGADLLPTVGASGGAGRSWDNPAGAPSSNASRWNGGADIGYELDLFGGNRANIASATANLRATRYNAEAVRLVVMSEVANGYFSLLNSRERLGVADRNLDLARNLLELVEAQFDAGRASALAVAQQRSALASAEASRASTALQLKNREHALAILLGKAPANLSVAAQELTGLNLPALAPEQPSTLLERRPDIRAAEASLEAANANIGAARSAFFPKINLSAGAGFSAAGFGEPSSAAYSLGSSLTAPIFQGGRLKGGLEQASARQQELVETYRKTVLESFREVEDALAATSAAQLRETALSTAMTEAQTSYDLSVALYDVGSIDFITLLDAQRTLLSAEDGFVQSRYERLAAAIDLFKALGGGWQETSSND